MSAAHDPDQTPGNSRAANRARWRDRSAMWRSRAAESPPVADATSLALIEAVGIATGMRVLDLASGPGDPVIPIAELVAPAGLAIATDQAEEMLAAARERAGAAARRTVAATMEELPFADATFDGLTCRFGIMFPPDRVAAASEARRVLRPGARAGYIVWGPAEDNAMFHVVREVVREMSGGAAASDDPQRHSLAAPGALASVLRGAGFREIEERELRGVNDMPPGRRFWQRALEMGYADWFGTLDESGRAALERRIVAAYAPYRAGEGHRLPTHIRLGVGVAP
jgi:SAM-dependent methyltransferase